MCDTYRRHTNTVGPVLNAWFNDCVLHFAHVDAAVYGVLLLDLLLIANHISHLMDTRNQNQSYGM